MNWPLVSRARYEDLKAEFRELKEAHERIVDAAYFIQTGFHLYARFEQKAVVEVAPKQAANDSKADPAEEPATIRAALRTIEARNISEFEEKRKTLQAVAAASMEATLREADTAAASQGAD